MAKTHQSRRQNRRGYLALLVLAGLLLNTTAAYSESSSVTAFRTFISLQKYTIEQTGDSGQQPSNVRLELTFPNGATVQLPENGEHWMIGNGQLQEIGRTFELPFSFVQNDGFRFRIQMIRQGSKMLPCEFDVAQLSQFNRTYVCHTDLNWQNTQNIPPEKQDREGLQIRVFTDRQSQPKDIPQNVIAIR